MKINAEMDIPIIPNHCPSLFSSCISAVRFLHSSGKKIYKCVLTYFTQAAPSPGWGKTIWICVASQTILIKSYWLGIELLACRRGAADPSGSRSLMSSTAAFTGPNMFNMSVAHMLLGVWFWCRAQTCTNMLWTRAAEWLMKLNVGLSKPDHSHHTSMQISSL